MPSLLWLVLLVGAGLLVVDVVSFADRSERFTVQALMIGSVATVLVLGLSMVRYLDRPYQGADGLQPAQMSHTLRVIEGSPVASATLPCDDTGLPKPA